MKESTLLGMKTFDQSLVELYHAGEISYEDALRHADSSNEVRLRIKLARAAMRIPCRRVWMGWSSRKTVMRTTLAGATIC